MFCTVMFDSDTCISSVTAGVASAANVVVRSWRSCWYGGHLGSGPPVTVNVVSVSGTHSALACGVSFESAMIAAVNSAMPIGSSSNYEGSWCPVGVCRFWRWLLSRSSSLSVVGLIRPMAADFLA